MMTTKLAINDAFIFHEMLVHPALFSHVNPKYIALIGNNEGTIEELLKHPNVKNVSCIHKDCDIHHHQNAEKNITYYKTKKDWIKNCKKETVDIIIFTEEPVDLNDVVDLLKCDGMVIYPAFFSFMQLDKMKQLYGNTKLAGFAACQFLHFPQPNSTPSWQTIVMASKQPTFKRVREIEVFNKTFSTRYYNYDMHKAALGLPEFLREELAEM